MKRLNRIGLAALLAAPAACSSATPGSPESTATTAAALVAASGRPRPNMTWQGTDAELIMADALAQCAWEVPGVGINTYLDSIGNEDQTLAHVMSLMQSSRGCYQGSPACGPGSTSNCAQPIPANSSPPAGQSVIADWTYQRQTPYCNYSPGNTGSNAAVTFNRYASFPYLSVFSNCGSYGNSLFCPPSQWPEVNAALTVARPEIYLCIASLLREEFPGTAQADAIYLDGSDLRYLNDTGRRLANESVVQFSQVYELATAQFLPSDYQTMVSNPLNGLGGYPADVWSNVSFLAPARAAFNSNTTSQTSQSASTVSLPKYANDFSQALQLAAAFTDDELAMQRRDDFANTPRGGSPQTVPDRTWDPMSWYQRAGATLYGGNALAYQRTPPTSGQMAPWSSCDPNALTCGSAGTPTFVSTSVPNYYQGPWDWPTWDELPWVRNQVRYTQTNDLTQVALHADMLDVPMTPVTPTQTNNPGTYYPGEAPFDQSCFQVDTSAGVAFYNNIEIQMRQKCMTANSCPNAGSGPGSTGTPMPQGPGGGNFTGYLLYQNYGITPSDATVALATLHDVLGDVCTGHSTFRTNFAVNGSVNWNKNTYLTGANPGGAYSVPATDQVLHIGAGSSFQQRSDRAMAALFNRNSHFNLQNQMMWGGMGTMQGFIDESSVASPGSYSYASIQNEGALGTNQTLSAAKLALVESAESAGLNFTTGKATCNPASSTNMCSSSIGSLFSQQSQALAFIAGKVGPRTITLRPSVTASYTSPSASMVEYPNGVYGLYNSAYSTGSGGVWQLDVIAPTNDPFWGGNPWSGITLYAVPDQPWIGDLARNPTATYMGQNIAYYLTSSANNNTGPSGNNIGTWTIAPTSASGQIPAGSSLLNHGVATISLPTNYTSSNLGTYSDYWTIVAKQTIGGTTQYAVLVDGFRYTAAGGWTPSNFGYYHSEGGGTENLTFDAMRTTSGVDPSQPAIDPFGIPTNWVPPTNPQLYGGDTALQHYMSQAQTAATNATQAANAALQNMIQEQTDQSILAAERASAKQIALQTAQEFCGTQTTANPSPSQCDTSTTPMTLAAIVGITPATASAGLPQACLGGASPLTGVVGNAQTPIVNGPPTTPPMLATGQQAGKPYLFLSPGFPGTSGYADPGFNQQANSISLANALFPMSYWPVGYVQSVPLDSMGLTDLAWGASYQVNAEIAAMMQYIQPSAQAAQSSGCSFASATPCTVALPTIDLPAANGSLADAMLTLECYFQRSLQLTTVQVSTPVAPYVQSPVAPSFPSYSGGTLQTDFLREWQDINALVKKYNALINDINMTYLAMFANNGLANAANAGYAQCLINNAPSVFLTILKDIGAAIGCIASVAGSVMSEGTGTPAAVGACAAFASTLASSNVSSDAQIVNCQSASASATAQQDQLAAQAASAQAKLLEDFQDTLSQTGAIATDLAAIAGDAQKAQDAVSTANMNLAVQTAGLPSLQGEYLRVNNYDAFQAGAQIEMARTYGVLARRALEATYVMNLDNMTKALPLVDAPTNWADSIYAYDLSMAQTIGTQVSTPGSNANAGVFPNTVSLYDNNLQAVIDSVPVIMPSSYGTDTALVTYDGPLATTQDANGQPQLTQGALTWEFFCPGANGTGGSWATMPSLVTSSTGTTTAPTSAAPACGGTVSPTQARLSFYLDPTMNQTPSGTTTTRFNQRWTQLAVNLVGTGIRDCSLLTNATACYTNPYITGTLLHQGPSMVRSWDGSTLMQAVLPGNIDGLKALAAEEVLDPISNGFSQSYVQSVARTEFQERPFAGMYTLVLALGREVQVQNILSVQILGGESYWVPN
jgi:hypothetical protein